MKSLSPVKQARWARFCHNSRAYWSLWLFMLLFAFSLCSELIANDRALLERYQGQFYLRYCMITARLPLAARCNAAA